MDVGTADGPSALGSAGVGPTEVDLPQVYDGFSPFVYFWLESLGLCPVGEAHRLVAEGGIDSDRRPVCPCSPGWCARERTDARRPADARVLPPAAGRAGERQRGAPIGLACHSSPHYGGAILYSADPL